MIALASVKNFVNRILRAPEPRRAPEWFPPTLANAKATAPLFTPHRLPYREYVNPLRSLTIERLVPMLERADRGDYADIQWLYRFVEKRHPILTALIARYEAGMRNMEWRIDTVSDKSQAGLAEKQAAALREAYDRIDNLPSAVKFLCSARFRGYAHLERHLDRAGDTIHLEPVPQWHWLRPNLTAPWQYNAEAKSGQIGGTPIDPARFIIRETDRPLDELGALAYIRRSLSLVDWDGYLASYGIPPCFVTGPPGVTKEEEKKYQEVAEQIATNARGYLPSGASVQVFAEAIRGVVPFLAHITQADEDLVIAATGGLLTMFARSGSGTLAGGAHMEVWREIVSGEAQEIAEIFQAQFDAPLLAAQFPGRRPLAWFNLGPRGEIDVGEVVDQTAKLSQAGYRVDPEQLAEKTGYRLTSAAPAETASGAAAEAGAKPPFISRATRRTALVNAAATGGKDWRNEIFRGLAEDLAPLRKRLAAILDIEDPEVLAKKLKALRAELPALYKTVAADPAETSALAGLMADAMTQAKNRAELTNRFDPNQPRDTSGKWSATGGAASEARAERARASHIGVTKEKWAIANREEKKVAAAVGGKHVGDNEPFDVHAGKTAVEVKTIVEGRNPKITMHPESLARKQAFLKERGMNGATVAVDARRSPPTYYYAQGVGSFRLSAMRQVKLAELSRLIA
jgi:phage gp29-like protein